MSHDNATRVSSLAYRRSPAYTARMLEIGYTSELLVKEINREHITLDGQQLGPVLMDSSEAPYAQTGELLTVFLFNDSRGNPMASLKKPLVQRGQCASLKVVDITNAGAFLDWGLSKNLLLPFAEQRRPLEIGRYESVWVYQDNSGRLAASSRLDHHLPETTDDFKPWQAVSLLIYQRTDLGLKAVVDNRAIGLLYKDEIFQSIRVGEIHDGYVKRVRHDGRIDLTLQPRAKELKPELSARIMAYLEVNNGICKLSDKSSPDAIQAVFQVSKKNFKKAISGLYRERKIVIYADYIALNKTPSN
ncbi:MAG: S1 RNA-binding domain-containing protein [Granulosicoccus sp.]